MVVFVSSAFAFVFFLSFSIFFYFIVFVSSVSLPEDGVFVGYQIQPEYGDEQADAGRGCRTCLAIPNSQARTRTGKYSFSLLS